MFFVIGVFVCVFGGIMLHALWLRLDPDFGPARAFFVRLSSPYNVLITFAAVFLLLLGGHNRPAAAGGGALVVCGFVCVAGNILRLLRPVLTTFRALLSRDTDAPVRPGRRPRLVWEESDLG